jgi:hypothetical protein
VGGRLRQTADWLLEMTEAAGIEVILCKYPPPPGFDNSTEYYPQYSVTHQVSVNASWQMLAG